MRNRPTSPQFSSKPDPHLPLWPRVLFVDWHGVLSRDIFWFSILNNRNHRFHSALDVATKKLFHERTSLVKAWMRGEADSASVIRSLEVPLDRRCKNDFLIRRLREDCGKMRVQSTLLRELASASSFVVLATDNMDCFIEQIHQQRDVSRTIDDVLCSSQLGVLKTENVREFFGPWLRAHHLSFENALLIDDTPSICKAFEASGGQAIRFDSIHQAVDQLRHWLRTETTASRSDIVNNISS